MNSSFNSILSDISKKVKEQDEERIVQDEENADLQIELQVLLL